MKILLTALALITGLSFAQTASASEEMSSSVTNEVEQNSELNFALERGICDARFGNQRQAIRMCARHGLGAVRFVNRRGATVAYGCDCGSDSGGGGWAPPRYPRYPRRDPICDQYPQTCRDGQPIPPGDF